MCLLTQCVLSFLCAILISEAKENKKKNIDTFKEALTQAYNNIDSMQNAVYLLLFFINEEFKPFIICILKDFYIPIRIKTRK